MHLIPKGQKAFKVGTKENKLHLMLHKTSSISYQSLFHAFSSGILKISSPVHNQTVLSLGQGQGIFIANGWRHFRPREAGFTIQFWTRQGSPVGSIPDATRPLGKAYPFEINHIQPSFNHSNIPTFQRSIIPLFRHSIISIFHHSIYWIIARP